VGVQGDGEEIRIKAEKVLVACGTRPAHSPEIPFDNHRIVDTDHLSGLGGLPKEIIVVGAGVVGLEFASFMAALGADVTLIDQRPALLEFVDRQIVEALSYPLAPAGSHFPLRRKKWRRLGLTRNEILFLRSWTAARGSHGDALIYAVGRQANGDQLHLEAAGLAADSRGRVKVNEFFQTEVPHVYAAGDVIGFPALASTSMEQGRLAASHMFGIRLRAHARPLSLRIYTIPEISMVGQTEETLTSIEFHTRWESQSTLNLPRA